MDLRQLEYFIQVANHGGFNRAASHMHIAQSALSRHIKELEHELGVTLFDRGIGGVRLTPEGEFMATRTVSLLRQFRQIRDEVCALSDEPRGELAVGLPPSLESLIVSVLRDFRAEFPSVYLTVSMGTGIEVREWLLNGKIDLAVYQVIEPETFLEALPIFVDSVYLIGAPGTDLSESVGIQDLPNYPLLLTSKPNTMRMLIEQAAHKRNVKLNVVMDVNSVQLTLDLVRAGAGFTVLSYCALGQLADQASMSYAKVRNVSSNWIVAHSRERPLSAAGRQMRLKLIERTSAEYLKQA